MRRQAGPALRQQQDDQLEHRAKSSKAASSKDITIAKRQDREREAAPTLKSSKTCAFCVEVPPAVASATCAHAAATQSRGTIDRCKVWRPSFTCRRTSRQRAHIRPPSTSRSQERPPHRKPSSKGVKDPTDLPESRPLSGSRAVTATRLRSTAFAKEHLLASETSLGYMDCCRVRTL